MLHTFAVLEVFETAIDVVGHFKNIHDASARRDALAQSNPDRTFVVVVLGKAR
jgi:hypothetical protein